MRILYQSPVSWSWIRQRPHFVVEGLAHSGQEIVWLYAANFLRCRRLDMRIGRLRVVEVPVLPWAYRCGLIAYINRWLVDRALRDVHPEGLIMTVPFAACLLPKRILELPIVYDCMDVQTAFFLGKRREVTARLEDDLVRGSRAIIATSPMIAEHLALNYGAPLERLSVVANGIDLAVIRTAVVAPEWRNVAYFGTISSWFDWNSVCQAAKELPQVSFDLYGPVDGQIPLGCPKNIILHGPVEHAMAIELMHESSVLIMPFVRNELIDGVDPVKMYEYLAVGRPIVASWWPLLEKFASCPAVMFYGHEMSLSQCLRYALSTDCICPIPYEFLNGNSWARRIEEINRIILANMMK